MGRNAFALLVILTSTCALKRINTNVEIFKYSAEGWNGYTEIDSRLITGQDPTSSALVVQAVIEPLENKIN
ncbi:MAG: hypothetical protein RIF33_22450 [Cyclobacteriaceae bacterium]